YHEKLFFPGCFSAWGKEKDGQPQGGAWGGVFIKLQIKMGGTKVIHEKGENFSNRRFVCEKEEKKKVPKKKRLKKISKKILPPLHLEQVPA
ncbi:hypothetical protein, partial [Aetokthonos hydrillicola]|uniref:hypothetical protein n=1 Tax=Aetokthonos hydrillicola TaxID=1550245 RepID=UPI001ABB746A